MGDEPLVYVSDDENTDESGTFGSTDEKTPIVELIATSKPKRNMDEPSGGYEVIDYIGGENDLFKGIDGEYLCYMNLLNAITEIVDHKCGKAFCPAGSMLELRCICKGKIVVIDLDNTLTGVWHNSDEDLTGFIHLFVFIIALAPSVPGTSRVMHGILERDPNNMTNFPRKKTLDKKTVPRKKAVRLGSIVDDVDMSQVMGDMIVSQIMGDMTIGSGYVGDNVEVVGEVPIWEGGLVENEWYDNTCIKNEWYDNDMDEDNANEGGNDDDMGGYNANVWRDNDDEGKHDVDMGWDSEDIETQVNEWIHFAQLNVDSLDAEEVFKALLDGFVNGCKPVLGLDGCFLKGKFMFQVLPHQNHMFCFMHMWKNFKKDFRESYLERLCWGATKLFLKADKQVFLDKLQVDNPEAKRWLDKECAEYWCRYCSEYRMVSSYVKTYSGSVLAISDPSLWDKTVNIEVLPPPLVRGAGRPRKVRRKGNDEGGSQKKRCHKYEHLGHNKKTCKGPPAELRPRGSQPTTRVRGGGRPRGNRPRDSFRPRSEVIIVRGRRGTQAGRGGRGNTTVVRGGRGNTTVVRGGRGNTQAGRGERGKTVVVKGRRGNTAVVRDGRGSTQVGRGRRGKRLTGAKRCNIGYVSTTSLSQEPIIPTQGSQTTWNQSICRYYSSPNLPTTIFIVCSPRATKYYTTSEDEEERDYDYLIDDEDEKKKKSGNEESDEEKSEDTDEEKSEETDRDGEFDESSDSDLNDGGNGGDGGNNGADKGNGGDAKGDGGYGDGGPTTKRAKTCALGTSSVCSNTISSTDFKYGPSS
ncbi:hypothetical protein GIB67_019514, partial [Kingdonia uniflora]